MRSAIACVRDLVKALPWAASPNLPEASTRGFPAGCPSPDEAAASTRTCAGAGDHVREYERFAFASAFSPALGPAIVHAHSLYREHHPWLQGLLRKRVGNRDDAADLAHDIFLRVMGSAVPVQEIREPQRYLATVARGMVADFFRRRSLEQAYVDYLSDLPGELAPSAEDQAIVQETLVAVDRMLLGLPDKVRQAFLLAHFGDLSYPEIAQALSISLRTVSNYLTRALEHCCIEAP